MRFDDGVKIRINAKAQRHNAFRCERLRPASNDHGDPGSPHPDDPVDHPVPGNPSQCVNLFAKRCRNTSPGSFIVCWRM
jgi:hypothetical protein